MKILLVNKFFYHKGGDTTSFFNTAGLLKEKGHEPSFFSMEDRQNLPSPYSSYFVSNVDFGNGGGAIGRLRIAGRILYSLEARRNIERLIKDERPDVAHLHSIYHQISPSIIDALKNSGVPAVMTLHDYKLTCPAYTHMSKGGVCEKCGGGRYYKAVTNRCTKGSLAKSVVNAAEMYLHHRVLRIYDKVDLFISPSRFLMEKSREMGLRNNIVHLPNFVDAGKYSPSYGPGDRTIVYFGRLSPEKGLMTLLEAVKGLDVKLNVIGRGPQKDDLMKKAVREGIGNVNIMGHKKGAELSGLIGRSMFTVLPSEWYENNPLTVIESFALGKPVIGARIGGIPELVKDGETGLTFEPGNGGDLREKIKALLNDRDAVTRMGGNARRYVEEELSPARHYEGLMSVYESAIKRGRL